VSIARHFLGWDAPIAAKVREFLLPEPISGPVDMEECLVIAPTRQAGRRLREALAGFCAERNSALLSARVAEPTFFLHDDSANEANPLIIKAAWSDVLLNAELNGHSGLFPAKPPTRDRAWTIHTGEMIQRLRHSLADGGYRISDVVRVCGTELEEIERWQNMAELEGLYLERLTKLGLEDPCVRRIARAEDPEMPPHVTRIVVAAVPDPSLLMIRALNSLTDRLTIDILVHAPESLSDHFDQWGRADRGKWEDVRIDIPDAGENVILCGTPTSQSERVIKAIATECSRYGPADVAVGVPDRSVAPFLEADLEEKGLPAFDPSDRPLKNHPLFRLIEAYASLIKDRSYASFSALLRHPDLLGYLAERRGISPLNVLQQLDEFQNAYLPAGFRDMTRLFPAGRYEGSRQYGDFDDLAEALAFVGNHIEAFETMDLDDAVRGFLQTVYESRTLDTRKADDSQMVQAADEVDGAMREFSGSTLEILGVSKMEALGLFVRRLAEQSYHRAREDALIDLEGWLELPWNDAPLLIVTGMNEGFVPDSRMSDVFLPDSLRTRLHLRDDAARLARDAFLMRGLIESRRDRGRVCFIAGKTSSAGDPLKPSRLLFRCSDKELTGRAERLFGPIKNPRENHPSTVSFMLDPCLSAEMPEEGRPGVKRLAVTSFREYLACPFRFYLKHVLQMSEIDDAKAGMDALDFGIMIHSVLESMASDPDMSRCKDERRLTAYLERETEHWVQKRFGSSPSLPVLIALDAAKQRLGAAAAVQALMLKQGWDIVAYEKKIEKKIEGVVIAGKIDRIDRHAETGEIRVIDYKTSDKEVTPAHAHLASASEDTPDFVRAPVNGKHKRWIDLQLPLYRELLADDYGHDVPVTPAYFSLPRAIGHTDVYSWDGFDVKLLESASRCALELVRRIRECVFWPPSERVANDDFERLFHGGSACSVDGKAFQRFLKGATS